MSAWQIFGLVLAAWILSPLIALAVVMAVGLVVAPALWIRDAITGRDDGDMDAPI